MAPADAFAADCVEGGGAARLPDEAVRARGVHASQDRADVVRVLDAVEHDEQGRAAGVLHELADAVLPRGTHLGDHTLMHAVATSPVELPGLDAFDRNVVLGGQRQQTLQALVIAASDEQAFHATCLQRLGDRVHAVDDHPSASANVLARARHAVTGDTPLSAPSAAPVSMAGTSRSSSGPSW